MPKISILVPIYNVEQYLRECLDSLIHQTLSDIEIICLNDGSTDSSKEILEEYAAKDKRVKVINKENSGYGHSMNIGLDNAKGEYIGILESDDFTALDMFEELYNIAKENNADYVKSDWYDYYTKRRETRKAGRILPEQCNKVFTAKDDMPILRMQPSIWSGIYKREFLKKNDIRFLETPGASYQDTSFSFKVAMASERIVFTNKAYVRYRQDNINSSCKSKSKVYAICDEYNEIERYLNERTELKQIFGEYVYAIQYRAYYSTIARLDKSFRKEFLDVYSDKFKSLYESGALGTLFFEKNKKEKVMTLINNKEKFMNSYNKKLLWDSIKNFRKKIISIKINSSRVSITVFGRQIMGIG